MMILILTNIKVPLISIADEGYLLLKNRHFIIQERFNKLIYDINTIMKGGT